eukprot:15351357-Ditylum_brightwellii.AAC.1
MGRGCISIQIWMPSETDTYQKISHMIFTSHMELVISLPMSQFLSQSDYAFKEFTKKNPKFKICKMSKLLIPYRITPRQLQGQHNKAVYSCSMHSPPKENLAHASL